MSILFPVSDTDSITSYYGSRTSTIDGMSTNHLGIDFGVPVGTKVNSATDGFIEYVGYNDARGNYVKVYDADSGITTIYQHLKSALVSVGDMVTAGQTIALSGNTGTSTGAHLHFETLVNGENVDPMTLLTDSTSSSSTDLLEQIKSKLTAAGSSLDSSDLISAVKEKWYLIAGAMIILAFILPAENNSRS